MTTTASEAFIYQHFLEDKQEKSASQMEEVPYAAQRELVMRSLGRESHLVRAVRTALWRIHGSRTTGSASEALMDAA
jgi:hypothetical protein